MRAFLTSAILLGLMSGCTIDEVDADLRSPHGDSAEAMVRQLAVAPATARAELVGIAPTPSGRAIAGGWFEGTLAFGAGDGETLVSAGNQDMFVLGLGDGGEISWARRFGDEAEQELRAVAAADGALYLLGHSWGSIDFGDGVALTKGGLEWSPDVVVARLDSAGRAVWARRIALLDGGYVAASALTADQWGNVYLAGPIEGRAQVGTGEDAILESPAVATFLARFDATGELAWTQLVPGADLEVKGLAADSFGNVFLLQDDSRGKRIFLTKWTGGGEQLVERSFDGNQRQLEIAHALSTDCAGRPFIAGAGIFGATVDQPDASLDARPFVAGLSRHGVPLWTRREDALTATRVAGGCSGAPIIAGTTPVSDPAGGPALEAAFLARLPATGATPWKLVLGPGARITALATERAPTLLLGGAYEGALELGGAVLTTGAGRDLFIARLPAP